MTTDLKQAVGAPPERHVGRLRPKRAEWVRGYYCAVAVLLREQGHASTEVRSLYEQGGKPQGADPEDAALFAEHGLTPNSLVTRSQRDD